MARVLVVGFGTDLRGDDALGLRIAQALRERVNGDLVEVLEFQQPLPELAENLSQVELAIFVDASIVGEAGALRSRQVRPKPGPKSQSHIFDPSVLLNLALNVYKHAPRTYVVTVTGQDFGFAEALSPIATAAVPAAVAHIEKLIESHLAAKAGA